MENRTTLQLRRPVLEALKRFGLKGETYEDILIRLMRQAKKERLMERVYAAESEAEVRGVDLDEL